MLYWQDMKNFVERIQ